MNKEQKQSIEGLWKETIEPALWEDFTFKSRVEMLEVVSALYINCVNLSKEITKGNLDGMIYSEE